MIFTDATRVVHRIHANHKLEEIDLLSYDGQDLLVVNPFSKDTNEICAKIDQINFQLAEISSTQSCNIMNGLVACFKNIEETLGIHTHTQIIIFTEYTELSTDEMFKIRPPFPVKLHIFSTSKLHHTPSITQVPKLGILATTPKVKEENSNNPSQKNIQETSTINNSLKQLSKLYEGHCYFVSPTATVSTSPQNPITLDESIINEFIKKHYDKYSGYLVFGHLVSPIELHPDPNLVMWLFDRQQQGLHPTLVLNDTSFNTTANERSSCHVPPILNIVGFIPGTELSSPKCISKHTILPLNPDETEQAYGVRVSRRDRETLYGKHKKIIKADACKADEAPASFYQLLHQTLLKGRQLNIPPPPPSTNSAADDEQATLSNEAKRICAIVSLGGVPERFAYITACNDGDSSSLILGVFNELLEVSQSDKYSKNIPKTQLACNNLAYPWLCNGVGQMIDEMAHANSWDIPVSGEQFDLFTKNVNLKSYNYDLKQSKTSVVIPFQKNETLSNDFGKIQRNIKNLPKKTDLVTNECDKLRYISQVFHNPYIIETLKNFFAECIENNYDLAREEPSTEVQEQLLKANCVMKELYIQLEKDPKAKLKPPKDPQYFEPVKQELVEMRNYQQQQHYQAQQQQQQHQILLPTVHHTQHHVHHQPTLPIQTQPPPQQAFMVMEGGTAQYPYTGPPQHHMPPPVGQHHHPTMPPTTLPQQPPPMGYLPTSMPPTTGPMSIQPPTQYSVNYHAPPGANVSANMYVQQQAYPLPTASIQPPQQQQAMMDPSGLHHVGPPQKKHKQ